jgi:hypothetical protein
MRFGEVLLEYDRSKTMDRYGAALAKRVETDNGLDSFEALQKAIQYALEKHLIRDTRDDDEGPEVDREREIVGELRIKFLVDAAVETIENADPTANKEYVPWIITRYIKGGINRIEDVRSTVSDCLQRYDAAKRSGYFRRTANEGQREYADIGRFQTLRDLWQFTSRLSPADVTSNAAADRALEKSLIDSGQVEVLYNDNRFKIVNLKSEAAAKFYGRNTQWCTAAKNNNMFSRYINAGPLICVLEKPTNRRWQFHFQDGQFMDESDQPIRWDPAAMAVDGFPAEIFSLMDWHPWATKLSRESCIELLQGWPEDDLDFIIKQADYTAITIAYPRIGPGKRRDIIREAVKKVYRPQYRKVQGQGFELLIWKGGWPSDRALCHEIVRVDWSPIWEMCPMTDSFRTDSIWEVVRLAMYCQGFMIAYLDDGTMLSGEVDQKNGVCFDYSEGGASVSTNVDGLNKVAERRLSEKHPELVPIVRVMLREFENTDQS